MNPVKSSNPTAPHPAVATRDDLSRRPNNYSSREMREAVASGGKRRTARRLAERATGLNAPDQAKRKQSAQNEAQVFRHSRMCKLHPSSQHKVISHPARRSGDDPALSAIRQIKADEFLARKMAAEAEQTMGWAGSDIAAHQGVMDHRGASSGEFDRTCGASVQQPSGNSSTIRQHFFSEDFYTLFSQLGTNEAEQLFHNLTDDQKDQFRDYCLTHVNLGENEVLIGLLFP